MAITSTNLVMGVGSLYVADFGAAEPTDIETALGASWIDVGGTLEGVTVNYEPTWTPLRVDQVAMDVDSRLTEEVLTVATQMAEVTFANMRLAYNLPAGAGGFELGGSSSRTRPNYRALIFEGEGENGEPVRAIVRKALSAEAVETGYKADEQTVLAVTWKAHFVSSEIAPFRIL